MIKENFSTNNTKNFIYFDDRDSLHYLMSTEGKQNLLPAISIACSPTCDLSCPHCIYDAGKPTKNALTVSEKIMILKEAIKLGARYLQICHEGEPFLDLSTKPLIELAFNSGLNVFVYTNATKIDPVVAKFLYDHRVRLGVKFDSMNSDIFNKMIGGPKSDSIYQGVDNLLKAGYNKPVEKDGKLYTYLSLVVTLTSLNTECINDIKNIARYCWRNNIFFGAARLEQGGRAVEEIWRKYKIPDKQKVIELIEWCSEQTGINYWDAQPTPYCIGVTGLQVADNGDVWITKYGGSCDFTEPDGESYPDSILTIGNIRNESLQIIVNKLWEFRKDIFEKGLLEEKLKEYERTKDTYPNGLQDCGSARTYTLFRPFFDYVKSIVGKGDTQ